MDSLFAVKFSYLIPLLPLIGAVVSGLLGAKLLKGASHWPIWLGVGASAVLSISLLVGAVQAWPQHGTYRMSSGPAAQVAPDSAAAGADETPGIWASPSATRWFTWIRAGDPERAGTRDFFDAHAGAWIDPLTCIMLCVVTVIGFFITVFSAGYMKDEEGYFRFFAYMGLFIFAMTVLVMADNFIMMYMGWEGVGLCSYLLIGYYYDRPSARDAAKKAFIVNRVGDFGFSLGIMLAFLAFGTVSFFGSGPHTGTGLMDLAATPVTSMQVFAQRWVPFLLMLGAFGKSAQFPLYVWLPDAMEGPTPVSALIHAATMVTAGVYMIVRCSTLFVGNYAAMMTIAVIGAFTAIFAATIALRQFDLKKVFAYSTISQLGYMFVGVGVLCPVGGIFHLVTHAFFKALLFLSCGVVMHAMAGELDMRKMSGLKRVLPWTNKLMLVGCLALAGCPFFSGFFSKDQIIDAAFKSNPVLGITLLVAAFLTAYYTFRLYFRVFQGPEVIPAGGPPAYGSGHDSHAATAHAAASAPAVHTGAASSSGVDVGQTGKAPATHHHNHEPVILIVPLLVLALGAIAAGYLNWPARTESLGGFLAQSPSIRYAFHQASAAYGKSMIEPSSFGRIEEGNQRVLFSPLMIVSAVVALAGIVLAYFMHLRSRAASDRLAISLGPITRLIEARFWVDEIYKALIVGPLHLVGKIFYGIDRLLVDGIVWLVGFIPQASGFVLKLTTQRGYVQGYAASMLFGVAIILVIVFR